MRKGFTLIELLVVIAIIAVLAAILFPVFARAKHQAKQTTCVSNMKQIGGAIGMYMSDYDDIFPHAVDPIDKNRPEIWDPHPEFQQRIPYMPLLHDALQPYAKSYGVFHCPADDGTDVLDNFPWIEFKTSPSCHKVYGTSYSFRTEIAFKFFSQTTFQLPTDVNVLFDTAGHWHARSRRLKLGDGGQNFRDVVKEFRYSTLFGDLHAKAITYDKLKQAWDTEL
ncbi:MAG: hypothetical protein HONBIEJF_02773 [Fimbriimonadaceae bacterium]|nr:hypothetical protein [Fimbriimonadaceae bacterium]